MFRFAHPEYLYVLYAVPALAALFWYLIVRGNRLLGGFAQKKLQNIIMPNFSRPKTILKYAILLLAITLLIISAADPQIGTSMQEVKQTGIDVYICLDVSLSMKAEDIKPNRLEKAKYQISTLIRKLKGDRIGLAIFAGEAYIQFPLTTDRKSTRLNSSHLGISYAVFSLKKKNNTKTTTPRPRRPQPPRHLSCQPTAI